MDAIKDEMGVPKGVRSCHTALLERYLVEGHVPAADLRRLLEGAAGGGGARGAGHAGEHAGHGACRATPPEPYEVLAFARDGKTTSSPGTAWRERRSPVGADRGRDLRPDRATSSGSIGSGSRPGSRSRTPTGRRSPIPAARSWRRAGRSSSWWTGTSAGDLRGDAALGRCARDRQDGGGARGAGAGVRRSADGRLRRLLARRRRPRRS